MITANNLCLLVDLYELTMAQSYFSEKKDNFIAAFDLFVRRLPTNRGYLLCSGINSVVDYLLNLRFDDGAIDFLKSKNIFSTGFLAYLKEFRFSGDLSALEEGQVCFAQEPIIRITAPIIQAQIIESFLLNTINLSTTIATKASRVVEAANGRPVYDFSLRRCQGKDASLEAARSSFLSGCAGTSNVLAGFKYGIPVAGTMAHSFVMSFESELDAFRAYKNSFPDKAIFLVDTYNTEQGVKNAAIVAKELEKSGHKLTAIRLDSGNLITLSKKARNILNKAGLDYVKIIASGDLDEYKIQHLLKAKAPIDSFGVGTRMGVSCDYPYVDVAYKLSEIVDSEGKFLPTMKLSFGKINYPGRKQIFRFSDKDGNYLKDILALEDEKAKGESLLIKIIEKGKLIYSCPDLQSARKNSLERIKKLPARYKKLENPPKYPVEISSGLKKLSQNLSTSLTKRSKRKI